MTKNFLSFFTVCLILTSCSDRVDGDQLDDEIADIVECQKSISFKRISDNDRRKDAIYTLRSFIEEDPSVESIMLHESDGIIDVRGTSSECTLFMKYIGVSDDYPFNRIQVVDR